MAERNGNDDTDKSISERMAELDPERNAAQEGNDPARSGSGHGASEPGPPPEPEGEDAVLTEADLADEAARERFDVTADTIRDEYYQLSQEILDAFPKFSFPIDLFKYNEEAQSVVRIYRAGQRMHYSYRSKVLELCEAGQLFVSRSQHDIYTDYITEQLDLVLLDQNLTPAEIAESLYKAMARRQQALYESPVQAPLEAFRHDLSIFVECITRNLKSVFELICYMHFHNEPQYKRVNVAVVGLTLYMYLHRQNLKRKKLEAAAIGFFLHDLGMSKIPRFITDKSRHLGIDERKRVKGHINHSAELLKGLGLVQEEVVLCALQHHERMDGSGYPAGLSGEQISDLGRICAVADSYAAMIAERPHAGGMRPLQAAVTLYKDRKRYDQRITGLMLKILQDITC